MVERSRDDEEFELESVKSSDSLLLGAEAEGLPPKSYPYTVIYQDHAVVMDSPDIRESRILKLQYITLSFCFFIFGLSDATIGTIIPSIIEEYGVDHSQASYLFSAQFVGYVASSFMNNWVSNNYGLFGGLLIGQVASCICFSVMFLKPPFALVVAVYVLNGFGGGVLDSQGNLWIGKLKYHNQLLGLIHADYGLGGMISPMMITRLITAGHSWSLYYAFLAVLNLCIIAMVLASFRSESSWKARYLAAQNSEEGQGEVTFKEAASNKLVWFFSFVLFIYVGGELSLGSWIYNYLIVIKQKSATVSSYITSTYWLSMTLGRIILGFVNGHYFNDREIVAVILFCTIIAVSSFAFTVFYNFVWIQTVAICVIGFFVGPMFPTIVIVAIRYLPARLEVAGVGVLVAMGGSGAAVIPYLVGLVSTVKPNGGGLVWFPLLMYSIFQVDSILFVLFWLSHRK